VSIRVSRNNGASTQDRGYSADLETYGVEDWTREGVATYVEQRLADILSDMAPTAPVDVYRAVHLGTEMARREGLEVEPEAVAYAADRLKSKIERNCVYNSIQTVYSAFLSYRFLKTMPGGEKVVYIDHYKRRHAGAPEPRPVTAEPGIPHGEVLPVFSAASLAGKQVPPREWAVPDLIPCDTVTMLSGDGGVGKSSLAAQLAVAFATDTEWLSLKPKSGPVVFVSAEDDQDELHRRIASIADSEGIDLADLHDLHIVPLAGRDAVMGATEGRGGVVKETAVWRGLVRIVESVKPRLVALDTQADIFGGNELARTEARQFIGQLRGLAIKHRLAVLLLSHPSLSGMASGTGTSGSTAWSNSVRSRLYLETVKGDDGIEADPDLRTLTTKKANYGARGGRRRNQTALVGGPFCPRRQTGALHVRQGGRRARCKGRGIHEQACQISGDGTRSIAKPKRQELRAGGASRRRAAG
jgi:AAA domain